MRRVDMSKQTNQKGDTIIEVMLAIAVVGMVLGASYNIANRALMTGRYAQEQTEALKIAESEIEMLKYKASQYREGGLVAGTIFEPNATDPNGLKAFCILDDTALTIVQSTFTPQPDGSILVTNSCGASGIYSTVTTYQASADLFKVYVYWDSPIVKNARVEVAYKVYK